MAENKTKPTDARVEDYILSRASEQQRTDCHELMALLEKVTQHSPKMWGPSIVGYGSYRYTYESGRTGEAPLAGFAIRGRQLVVYLVAEGDRQKFLLSKLGKHNIGKSCLYFKKLADLDPFERLDRQQRIDEQAVASRRRDAACGGVRACHEAELLQIRGRSPLLCFERTYYAASGEPVEHAVSWQTGRRYPYRMILSRAERRT